MKSVRRPSRNSLRVRCSFSIAAIRAKVSLRNSRAMTATARRSLTLIEALAFCGYVGWYMWRLETTTWSSWIAFPVWLVASFVLHGDTPKTLGWRAENFWIATKPSAAILGPFAIGLCFVGLV